MKMCVPPDLYVTLYTEWRMFPYRDQFRAYSNYERIIKKNSSVLSFTLNNIWHLQLSVNIKRLPAYKSKQRTIARHEVRRP